MKNNKNSRAKIVKMVRFWQTKLGLINWDVGILFQKTRYPKETENFKGIAKTDIQVNYKMATITFEPSLIKLVTPSVIVHELLHCLLAEIIGYSNANIDKKKHEKKENWLEYFEEGTVSELERIILRVAGKNAS